MQQGTSTQYSIAVTTPNQDSILYSTGMGADLGWNDASILALVQTLRGFAWPAALAPVTVSANKSVDEYTFTSCSPSTNPPAFN
jgi:hypothetical protein